VPAMKTKVTKKLMARVIFRIIFISGPAIIVSGYCVYLLRNWLAASKNIEMSDLVYGLLLILVMWAAMWLSSGKLISELQSMSSDSGDA